MCASAPGPTLEKVPDTAGERFPLGQLPAPPTFRSSALPSFPPDFDEDNSASNPRARDASQRRIDEYVTRITPTNLNPYITRDGHTKKRVRNEQTLPGKNFGRVITDFECIASLGEGTYCSVKQVKHRLDGESYALKTTRRGMRENGCVLPVLCARVCPQHTHT